MTPQTSPSSACRALVAALEARVARGMRYDLQGIHQLLAALGAPQQRMQHVLVVGTNGKGSTSRLVAESLRHAGHRVGHYTSPHLVHVRERVVVNGDAISDPWLVRGLQQLNAVEPKLARPFSFFEGATALAAWYFARQSVDIAVWEAGLGGRLDATNAMPTAGVVAVIVTAIGLDHQAILGGTLGAIATEKAGALRPGCPAVIAPQHPEAMAAIERVASGIGAPIVRAPTALPAGLGPLPQALRAPFLQQNAALAEVACDAMVASGLACPPAARQMARAQFFWLGRYTWVPRLPTERLAGNDDPRRIDWLVDGGHNPAGCTALAAAIADDDRLRGRRIHVAFGALRDKDAAAMLAPLRPRAESVWLCACPSARSQPVDALRAAIPAAQTSASLADAMASIAKRSERAHGAQDVGLVTGSLTLVGQALQLLGTIVA